ncbi:hypothetical protein PVK06_041922 [Gossypium arboreum]|uniref:Disease resistance protein At3g14460 n=2 Tax=Gossypium arboreum TaxID=29729 RepID=A0ABR0N9K9_GOSAR|nr:hypothetical protein PVK06_041922 [Gossypium arboreum]
MLSLKLRNCKNYKSLPSIGRLLLLKDLSISGLDQVHKIGAELFGENQSNAFASLESLCFDNMLNWEEWDLCEDDEQVSKFPSLSKLSIKSCPLLWGRLPTILQSLQKLEISECRRLVVSILGFPLLSEISVEGCQKLVDEGSLSVQKVTSLKHVSLSNISKFNISAERIMLRFANSEKFDIYDWEELGSLSQIGLRLVGHRFIEIVKCPQLISLEKEKERLQLDNIPGVESLLIVNCENFGVLPKCINNFTSLRELKVSYCSADTSFLEEGFPTNLTTLAISNVPKIFTSLVEWGFNRLTSLQQLDISSEGCSNVVSFPE